MSRTWRPSKARIKEDIKRAEESRQQFFEELKKLISTDSDEYCHKVHDAAVLYETAVKAKQEKEHFEKLIAGYGKDEFHDCPSVYKSNRDYYSDKQNEYYEQYKAARDLAVEMNENAVDDIKRVWYYSFKVTNHWVMVM